MIHRITYEDGSYNEWYEPGRPQCRPDPVTEPAFSQRTEATAHAISIRFPNSWGSVRSYQSYPDARGPFAVNPLSVAPIIAECFFPEWRRS